MLLLLTPKQLKKLGVVARFGGLLEVDWRSKLSSRLILVISINLCDSVSISVDLWSSKLILVISINLCDSVRISIDLSES